MKRNLPAIAIVFVAIAVRAQTYTMLHEFIGADGEFPSGELALDGNTLYGTTRNGGTNDSGTVFRVNTDGTDFAVIKSFPTTSGFPDYTNSDGAWPEARLTLDSGVLYGTTRGGGSSGNGVVFKLNTDGSGYAVLKCFSALTDNGYASTNSDGASPYGGLTPSGDTLYGTTWRGGSSGNGTVFSIHTNGTGFNVLRAFSATSLYPYYTNYDGVWPFAGLALSGSTLYGTTSGGGSMGGGTVFRMTTNGLGFTVLKALSNSDGVQSQAELTVSDGTLYGTTWQGGSSGIGTVFKMNIDGTGYTVLKNFTQDDGWSSYAGVLLSGSTLFGTTYWGGSNGFGTVFKVKTNGTGYTVLRNFSTDYPPQGAHPIAGLVRSGSTLYGTTESGGGFNDGTVFKLDLAIPLNIQLVGNELVLSWADPDFVLQVALDASGGFTNLPNAVSPYTNIISGPQQFFRLISN